MRLSRKQIAEAFSRHRFAETYPQLAAGVRWEPVGTEVIEGRDAVVAACESSSTYLTDVTTDFRKFRSVVGSDSVVIDSVAEYVDSDGQSSVVASCDIYDFVNDEVTAITSYTVELEK